MSLYHSRQYNLVVRSKVFRIKWLLLYQLCDLEQYLISLSHGFLKN